MKLLLGLLFVVYSNAELRTVPYVDPVRYVGDWYQISRNILPFEAGCECSRQRLSLRDDGLVGVYNSCNRGGPGGALMEISGVARNDDPITNARFTVDFGLPQLGKYWIIGLAADYSYAVVSEPSGRALYILSKTPFLGSELYEEAVAIADTQVDTSRLVRTLQSGCTYPE
jgi:apolipoprotein D and lipocalin family protein